MKEIREKKRPKKRKYEEEAELPSSVSAFCLHSELAEVMETLVLAAVAGLKRLLELNTQETDRQHVTVQFASAMETLGNEALGKILSILDKARVHLKLDKLKDPRTAKPHILYILRSTRVGVEHSYGAIHKRNRVPLPQYDHSYGETKRRTDRPTQKDKPNDWTELVPAITVQDKWGNINLDAIAENVEQPNRSSYRNPDKTQPTLDDHSYGAGCRGSDNNPPTQTDSQAEEQEGERAEPESVPCISGQDDREIINLDLNGKKRKHSKKTSHNKPAEDQPTQVQSPKVTSDLEEDEQLEKDSATLESDLDRGADMPSPGSFSPVSYTSAPSPEPVPLKTPPVLPFKGLRCTTCGESGFDDGSLREHKRIHKIKKTFACQHCERTFKMKKSLIIHERKHTGERPFMCTHCDKAYVSKEQLIAHLYVHTGLKPFCCKICGQGFTVIQNLTRHMRSHTGVRPFTCETCGQTFTRAQNLRDHSNIHTGLKPFKCSICDRGFSQRVCLRNHLLCHSDVRAFSCPTCPKAFRTKGALQAHERSHTGEKPFICPFCSRGFSQQSSLNVHVRVHLNERKFACPCCEKAFNNPQNLRLHFRLHSGEKPHICMDCGKTFTQNAHLRTHKLHMHSGGKQCMCEFCGKIYADTRGLRSHKCGFL